MGLLVDGHWVDQWYDTKGSGGRFERAASAFRHWVTADGDAGPSGEAGFPAQSGRYHLYVSYACPWAHRTLLMRALKGLERHIAISVVHWLMREDGWTFANDDEGLVGDRLHGARFLRDVYLRDTPHMTGRVTVPVLWDKREQRLVNNESAEIVRMLNSAFNKVGANELDFYPKAQRAQIDALNEQIYRTVNNGVYRAGFATTQDAYEEALHPLFSTLDELDARLAHQRYLLGSKLTEADLRLLPTLLRFDLVYHGHFKCNLRRLVDYPHLWAYTRDLYQTPGVAGTCHFEHAKRHYYQSHRTINPTGIVPAGPVVDFGAPHDRGA